jgi:carbonic anhydrase/acetyltransferase-like protein (isoleucine patch superfamily)
MTDLAELEKLLAAHFTRTPRLGKDVYVAPTAVLIGDVEIGDKSSVWPGAVLRADINRIVVGQCTSVQDNVVFHVLDTKGCMVGDYVTIGHGAILHGCTVGNEVLIGMGAIILDGAVIEDQTIVGAGAVVTPGTRIPSGSLVVGTPARVIRTLTEEEKNQLRQRAMEYVLMAAAYLKKANLTGRN